MDRRRSFTALLIAGMLAGAGSAAFPLPEAEWTSPERRVEALTSAPKECAIPPAGSAAMASYTIGRAAFHTPNLLGGQASRVGLSCASCHVNGRGNPDFNFPGLSGGPGTADVTSSIMSKMRGDGVYNPKPIPDLARGPSRISRAAGDPALSAFIRGLVVEEFDGPEPPPAVLEGLATYVRAQTPALCGGDARVKRQLTDELSLAADASEAAIHLTMTEDRAAMRLVLGAARAALGRINNRYHGPALITQRKRLAKLDKQLMTLQNGTASRSTARKIGRWQSSLAAEGALLKPLESQSLYNPDLMRAVLQR